jgi:hypothetical protein
MRRVKDFQEMPVSRKLHGYMYVGISEVDIVRNTFGDLGQFLANKLGFSNQLIIMIIFFCARIIIF